MGSSEVVKDLGPVLVYLIGLIGAVSGSLNNNCVYILNRNTAIIQINNIKNFIVVYHSAYQVGSTH